MVDSRIFDGVLESVLAVLQRKELLKQEVGVLLPRNQNPLSQPNYQIEPSDIREALKELGIVKQYILPTRTNSTSHSMLSGYWTTFNRQTIEDQETLIEQIQALFFTQKVNSIDYSYF